MSDLGLYDSASEVSSDYINDSSDEGSLLEPDEAEADSSEQSSQEQSSATASQAAKAIEAAAESSTDFTLRDRLNTPAAPTSRLPSWPDEHTPLLDAGPAPPDYAAATAWRRSLPSAPEDGAIDAHREPEEEPQISNSIADDTSSLHESSDPVAIMWTVNRNNTRKVYKLRRGRFRIIFGSILFIELLLLYFTVVWLTPSRRQQRVRRIADLDHPNTNACLFDRYSEYATYSFENPRVFSFKDRGDISFESTDDEEESTSFFSTGDVNLFTAPASQDAALEVWISVATTSPWEVAKLRLVDGWTSLTMVSPLLRRSSNHTNHTSDPCIHTWIGIFVKPSSVLESMKISAGYMNVSLGHVDPVWQVHADGNAQQGLPLSLTTLNLTVVTNADGNIDSRYLDARKTDLHTVFGSIKGTYALRDEIYLESRTGAVNVTVDPKIGDESGRFVPNFTVKSNWNPLHLQLPTFEPEEILNENSSIFVKPGYGFGEGNIPSGHIKMTWKEMGV